MLLFLDTSNFDWLQFAVVGASGLIKQKKIPVKPSESHKTAGRLWQFLGGRKMPDFSKFSKIIIVSGPGSFTGIRAGIALALGISQGSGVPLYALTKSQVPKNLAELAKIKHAKMVTKGFKPDYGAEPNITEAKN